MSDRARLSQLESWTQSDGSRFLGSKDFPSNLLEAVEQFDPAGIFLGVGYRDRSDDVPPVEQRLRLNQLMRPLNRKRILSTCSRIIHILRWCYPRPCYIPCQSSARGSALKLNSYPRATLLTTKSSTDMAGGADKLVPYKCSQPFIRWFQRAVQPGG